LHYDELMQAEQRAIKVRPKREGSATTLFELSPSQSQRRIPSHNSNHRIYINHSATISGLSPPNT